MDPSVARSVRRFGLDTDVLSRWRGRSRVNWPVLPHRPQRQLPGRKSLQRRGLRRGGRRDIGCCDTLQFPFRAIPLTLEIERFGFCSVQRRLKMPNFSLQTCLCARDAMRRGAAELETSFRTYHIQLCELADLLLAVERVEELVGTGILRRSLRKGCNPFRFPLVLQLRKSRCQ